MKTAEQYANLRHDLVYGELSRTVRDQRVLNALDQIPRHRFVPAELQPQAYSNQALAIGHGQTISQPLIVARMTEALDLKPTDRILEIGTGSGYQAAVLSLLASEVFTIELIEPLGTATQALLSELGMHNINCRIGDGSYGWPEEAPFDGIIVTAAPGQIPPQLINQLKEGGKLAIPLGSETQRLKLYRKINGRLIEEDLGAVRFVPMLGDAYERPRVAPTK